jgi:hypothetical protein
LITIMRKLKKKERDLIEFMLKNDRVYNNIINGLSKSIIREMDDGKMGSLRFIHDDGLIRSFGKEIVSISILDLDMVPVSFAINVDNYGDLFELDVFKGDFSPLKQFPTAPFDLLPPAQVLE